MVKQIDMDAQALRARVVGRLRNDAFSDDSLLLSEFIDQERTHRLRDLVDSLTLEGAPTDLADFLTTVNPGSDDGTLQLTERERDVLNLLATGVSNSEIATALTVTVNTVKTHLGSLYSKLGVHSRMDAAVRARELHLL